MYVGGHEREREARDRADKPEDDQEGARPVGPPEPGRAGFGRGGTPQPHSGAVVSAEQ